jgi:hypothetical protein
MTIAYAVAHCSLAALQHAVAVLRSPGCVGLAARCWTVVIDLIQSTYSLMNSADMLLCWL